MLRESRWQEQRDGKRQGGMALDDARPYSILCSGDYTALSSESDF